MKATMQVIEDRGYHIFYPVFFGTQEECLDFVHDQYREQEMENELPSWEQHLHNGDGQPFTFTIL